MRILHVLIVLMLFSVAFAAETDEFSAARALIASNASCGSLNQTQLEQIGDYFMELMHPGAAHEAMDQMMGGEGSASLAQAHIQMAEVLYCGQTNGTVTYGGMMGMMPAMYAYGPGMTGYGMMGYGPGYGMVGYGPVYPGVYGPAMMGYWNASEGNASWPAYGMMGYAPGYGMGYGAGYGMMGYGMAGYGPAYGYGPGMAAYQNATNATPPYYGPGYGPAMMGYGQGYGMMGGGYEAAAGNATSGERGEAGNVPYGMTGYGYGPESALGGWGWLVGVAFAVLLLAALILVIVWLYLQVRGRPQTSAAELLKQRYAKGEISKKQFDEMMKDLG